MATSAKQFEVLRPKIAAIIGELVGTEQYNCHTDEQLLKAVLAKGVKVSEAAVRSVRMGMCIPTASERLRHKLGLEFKRNKKSGK